MLLNYISTTNNLKGKASPRNDPWKQAIGLAAMQDTVREYTRAIGVKSPPPPSNPLANPVNTLPRTALVYDFDGTLAAGNLQERSFIPDIGMSREDFWTEVMSRARQHDADSILVYMQLMIEKAGAAGKSVTRSLLQRHGQQANLFPGLADLSWFDTVNKHARACGLGLEHYIVSSGIDEMIDGCAIRSAFKRVFASKFIYDDEGVAVWPGVAINFTTKTQYLFRINKGIETHWENTRINAFVPDDERPISFDRMIFIGDGDTDIPAMKMLTYQGGHAIAVYDPNRSDHDLSKIHTLISDGRVEFVAPADYSEKSQIEIIVKGLLGRIGRKYARRRSV